MYLKSTWSSADGNFIILKKYHALRAMPTSSKIRERRKPRKQETSLAQEEINRRHKAERIQRQLLDNFCPGDWYLTLTFATGHLPESEDAAKKILGKLKRNLRDYFHKKGKELIYIFIVENLTGRGRCHAHMMIPAMDPEDRAKLSKLWPYGHIEVKYYGGEQIDAFQLAEYFTKAAVEKTASQVMTSKNLVTTEPKKEQVSRAETYSDTITAPEGYEIVKQLTYTGYTYDGYPMQRIVLQRINLEYNGRRNTKDAHNSSRAGSPPGRSSKRK